MISDDSTMPRKIASSIDWTTTQPAIKLRYKCNPKITNIEEMGGNLIKHREGSCTNNSNINIERTIDKNKHVLY